MTPTPSSGGRAAGGGVACFNASVGRPPLNSFVRPRKPLVAACLPVSEMPSPSSKKLMRAALLERYGDNSAVKVTDSHPVDRRHGPLGRGSCSKRESAGRQDAQRASQGSTEVPPPHSSGVVTQVGAQVRRFKVGDEIYARLDKSRIGSFAEFAAVREGDAALKPVNTTFEEAASLPQVALTAWQALVELGRVKAGERALIHVGSGGVGSVAIQLAHHVGATVLTTVGQRNFDLVKRLGADIAIDYRTTRFEDVAKDCDVVLDSAGGETLVRSFKCVKPGGVVVSIGSTPSAAFARQWGLKPAPGLCDPSDVEKGNGSGSGTQGALRVPLHAP
jgi:hypothetical protein